MSARDAALARQSWSKVTDDAPSPAALAEFVAAAGRVADHSSLRPWRLIALRGDDRHALGAAIARAQGADEPSTKPLRAPLLVAVVASYRASEKVPRWEQEAVASGVAHLLSLLLDEAGWGVIWRTGGYTRSPEVAAVHGLGADEALLGWLYVGGKPERSSGRRKTLDPALVLSDLPGSSATGEDVASEHPGSTQRPSSKKPKKEPKKAKKKDPTARRAARIRKAEKKVAKLRKAERRLERLRREAAAGADAR
ncbi:nitroreductase family protein [Microbacterium resistens]|uniref:Nitroreductase family protein n=2 Tax=Microbacterium resistens TaxID=156977 RepID=A0ABY3RRF6_9MICO|nr:nitroreductase family protein [Microbacterium resistens]